MREGSSSGRNQDCEHRKNKSGSVALDLLQNINH